MRRFALTIWFAVIVMCSFAQSSYGLKFNSHETSLENRTALLLAGTDSLKLSKNIRLDFDLNFIRGYQIYFGYILRIINNNQNIDLIYDEHAANFKLIIGQTFSGLSFSLHTPALFDEWNTISFKINTQQQQLELLVNKQPIGKAPINLKSDYYKFLWGANDVDHYQTRDLPPMRLKDIKLFNDNQLAYYWPLDETKGTIALDRANKQAAIVKNPAWLKPAHQAWSLVNSLEIKGNAISAFDQKSEILYLAGSDSVFTYTVKNMESPWKSHPVNETNILIGSQGIYDTFTNKLYSIFVDKQRAMSYKPGSKNWDGSFKDSVLTEYWHSNKFISAVDTSIYIIGGYGQLKYKNSIERFSIPNNTWQVVHAGGNYFTPRYLAALGVNATGDTAFIAGGYGSVTGNQMLDPGNYTDMYAFDVRTKTFKKLFNLKTSFTKSTFANNLIIDSKNQTYYGLVFSNDSSSSNLQLIEGSLKNPSVRIVGNKIPYPFLDNQSYSDLYYSRQAGKLIAVTFFYSKFDSPEKLTSVKVYTIDFPPEVFTLPSEDPTPVPNQLYLFIGASSAVVVTFIVWGIRKRPKRKEDAIPAFAGQAAPVKEHTFVKVEPIPTRQPEIVTPSAPPKEELVKSTIFLFGQFQVFDNEGKDITGLFTPLTKELFLLILTHTIWNGRGITADGLNEILWTGKSSKVAKNNLSVNLTKIKSIIEKIGNCLIEKNRDFLQFAVKDDAVYVDYDHFMKMVSSKHSMNREYMEEILKLVSKGPFLHQTEYNWLDDVKAQVSNTVIDICLAYLNRLKWLGEDPEFIIEIANCIFYFDRLNEDALEYKCKTLVYLKRHALANQTYTKFAKDYKDMYGEEFNKSFSEMIKNDSNSHLIS